MNRISNRNRRMNRHAYEQPASVFLSLFRTCWTDSQITSEFNKPLRPHLALCENQAGMAQTGKALDCYLVPIGIGKHPVLERARGFKSPSPRIVTVTSHLQRKVQVVCVPVGSLRALDV